MDWSYLVHQLRVVFMLLFGLLAIWLMMKWVHNAQKARFTVRDWLGSLAFWLGMLSASVLGFCYAYFSVFHKLIADARGLLYFLEFGVCTAVAGILLGVAGYGWVRRAAVFVSVVAAFQWANLAFPAADEHLTTEAMLATLAVGVFIWFGIHLCFARLELGGWPRSR